LVNVIGCWLPCPVSCPFPREAAHVAGGHGDLPGDSHRAGAVAVTGVSIRWALAACVYRISNICLRLET
jgi:hypothetical protein